MTSEMEFECLLVSKDPAIYKTVSRILRDLSISTSICLSPGKATAALDKGSTDLVVIDWNGEESAELVHAIWKRNNSKKPTVVAVSPSDHAIPGVHIMAKKPLTVEAGKASLKTAYSRMLVDHRRHARYAVMTPVVATDEDGRTLSLTIVDIGDGGVGVVSKEQLTVGAALSFRLRLPDTPRAILLNVRVLWGREWCRYGCEFLRIPPVDLIILHEWLKGKQHIKKPLIEP
jgi:CheY-like chemotaxis protein